MADQIEMPLRGVPPKEIALRAAPLISVIAQVRFPALLAVQNQDRVAVFQEVIRKTYPHLTREEIPTALIVDPARQLSPFGGMAVHWRFADGMGAAWKWRISLTQDFISLESRAYQSRKDFLERLQVILHALEATLAPSHVTRLGMRYIDQIIGEPVSRIGSLLRTEVMGIAGSLGENAKQFFTELHVGAEPGDLVARWGKLPAGMTIDPNLVPPLGEDSWLIDLDVSRTEEDAAFNTATVIDTARLAAERVYAVFRWMVTPEFLQTYSGKV